MDFTKLVAVLGVWFYRETPNDRQTLTDNVFPECDYIVVGGGSAAVCTRNKINKPLSRDPNFQKRLVHLQYILFGTGPESVSGHEVNVFPHEDKSMKLTGVYGHQIVRCRYALRQFPKCSRNADDYCLDCKGNNFQLCIAKMYRFALESSDKVPNGTPFEIRPDSSQKEHVPREASRGRKCLVMLACVYLQAVTVGSMLTMPVLYAELIAVFGTSRSQVALLQSLYSGLVTAGGVLVTPLVKRYGPGPSVIVGTVVAAICMSSVFAVNSLTFIIVAVGVVAGTGMSFSYLASTISVSWIFHGDPGLALVFVTIGSGFGQTLFPFLIEVFIEQYRWNGAFLLLGGVVLQCVPCGCYIYTSRAFYKTDMTEKDMSVREGVKKICDSSLLRDLPVVLFIINTFMMAFTVNVEPWFFVDMITSRGAARSRGAFILTLLGTANMIGRVIGFFIRLKIKIKSVYHWIWLWPIISVSHILAITIYDLDQLSAVGMLYGVTDGTLFSLVQSIALDVCGLARYPQTAALVNLALGAGYFSISLFGGMIKDTTGHYDPVFYMASAGGLYIALSSSLIALLLRRRESTTSYEELN